MSQTVSHSQQPTFWSTYMVPPLAASVAIVPAFHGFLIKSDRQSQRANVPFPRRSFAESLKAGVRAAPTVGATVGTLVVGQEFIEDRLKKKATTEVQKSASKIASACFVAILSTPFYVVLNGRTMEPPLTTLEALRGFTITQGVCIATREMFFLISLTISGPLITYAKKIFGDRESVTYGTAFASGGFGSLFGHPFDTALTRAQKRMEFKWLQHSMKGAPQKALATGVFAALFSYVKNILNYQ
jgi:hypothetical protein